MLMAISGWLRPWIRPRIASVCARNPDGHIEIPCEGVSDRDIFAGYTDDGAASPLGLYVRQESGSFETAPDDDFVILRYFIENRSDEILDLHVGLFVDFDICAAPLTNTGGILSIEAFAYITDGNAYAGIRLLFDGSSTYKSANQTLIHNPTYVWPEGHVLDAEKCAFLKATDAAHYVKESPNPDDWSAMVSAAAITLDSGQVREIVFAILGGESLGDLQGNANRAQLTYLVEYKGWDPAEVPDQQTGLPGTTRILASIPNPVNINGHTTIRYELAGPSSVRLSVFDVGDRLIRSFADGLQPSGIHSVVWNTMDDKNRHARSGVYFVKLDVRSNQDARPIVLLK